MLWTEKKELVFELEPPSFPFELGLSLSLLPLPEGFLLLPFSVVLFLYMMTF